MRHKLLQRGCVFNRLIMNKAFLHWQRKLIEHKASCTLHNQDVDCGCIYNLIGFDELTSDDKRELANTYEHH